jgi:hypothetical protein
LLEPGDDQPEAVVEAVVEAGEDLLSGRQGQGEAFAS